MKQKVFWRVYLNNGKFISERKGNKWPRINPKKHTKIRIVDKRHREIMTINIINKNTGIFPLYFHLKTGVSYLTTKKIINKLKYFDIGIVNNKNGDCIIHRIDNKTKSKIIFNDNIKRIGLDLNILMKEDEINDNL